MNPRCQQTQAVLAAVREGRWDALSPADIAALETHLADCPACAAELAAAPAAPDAQTQALLAHLPAAPQPTAQTWELLWQSVGAALPSPARQAIPQPLSAPHHAVRRTIVATWLIRFWRPIAVAAAAVFMVGVWRFALRPAAPPELQLARNVQIDSLEVFGDASPIVYTIEGPDGGSTVIWIVDTKGA